MPVDVIRVDFWMRAFMKMSDADLYTNQRLLGVVKEEKFKILIAAIRIPADVLTPKGDQKPNVGTAALGCPSSEARRMGP
jgi:hypothetical protein